MPLPQEDPMADHHHQIIGMHLGRGDRAVDLDVVATYTYRAGYPGKLWGPPEHCYPPEGPEVELVALFAGAVDLLPLIDDDIRDEIIDTICENHNEEY